MKVESFEFKGITIFFVIPSFVDKEDRRNKDAQKKR